MASYDIILDKNGINCRTHDNTSATADHVKTTGHNIKWDHFDILAKVKTDYRCKIRDLIYLLKNLSQLLTSEVKIKAHALLTYSSFIVYIFS